MLDDMRRYKPLGETEEAHILQERNHNERAELAGLNFHQQCSPQNQNQQNNGGNVSATTNAS